MKLILIRHTSVNVPQGTCYGQSDVDVNFTFPEEARKVKEKLKQYEFTHVFTSPLQRCVKLAQFCGYENPPQDPRLMEINFGEWEMKRFSDIKDPRLLDWYKDYINVAAPKGESVIDQQKRLIDFIDELKSKYTPESIIALFTHGGIIINALVKYLGKTFEEVYADIPPYGSITEIEI